MLRTSAILTCCALLVPATTVAQQLPTIDDPVAYALSAGPPEVAAGARVMAADGTVLRAGSNGWTCIAMPGNPMCLDEPWMSWLDAYLNDREPAPITRIGVAYMLRGDTGASNIDPFATEPTADNDWVQTGPHLMLIVPDPALLEGIPTDHTTGGPYVMWKGHPLVHIMVPIGGGAHAHPRGH